MIQKLFVTAFILFISAPAYARCTTASFYDLDGSVTANGETFNSYSNTAAHPSLPFGTRIRVTNNRNNRSVVVRINDRGPFIASRGLDLSYRAFTQIASTSQGVADVCYRIL